MNIKSAHPDRSTVLVAFLRVVKIALAIMVVMIFSLGVLSVMALEKFKNSLNEVTESRIGVIAFDIKDTIELGLAMGYNLPALQNVQDTIRRARSRDQKISSIYVIGRQGETLYRAPDTAPDLKQDAVEKFRKASAKGPLASLRDGVFLDAFTNLQNSFSQPVGILLIKYDAASLEERYAAFRTTFFRQVIIFLFVGVVIATFAIWLLLRRFDLVDSNLAASLDAEVSLRVDQSKAPPAELAAFKAKHREALEAIIAAERVLEAR